MKENHIQSGKKSWTDMTFHYIVLSPSTTAFQFWNQLKSGLFKYVFVIDFLQKGNQNGKEFVSELVVGFGEQDNIPFYFEFLNESFTAQFRPF